MPDVLHVVETQRGGWECRCGAAPFDTHSDAASAIEHLRRLAAILGLSPALVVMQSKNDEVLAVISTLGHSAFDLEQRHDASRGADG